MSTYTISLPEILSNKIIFEQTSYRRPAFFFVKGIIEDNKYFFNQAGGEWLRISAVGHFEKTTIEEILEKIVDSKVQEEVLFHLDEIKNLCYEIRK